MPSRRRFLTALGTVSTAGLAGCAALGEQPYSPGTDDSTEWPMPGYDRGFSAYNPDAAAPRNDVTERWAVELGGLGPTARPVVAAGTVLVPTSAALVALALDTGEERWRHGEQQPWASAPVVHDGVAFVGFADQRGLLALDVETGDELWSVETDGTIEAAPTFDMGFRHLYAGDDTGTIYQVDPANGDVTLRGEVFGPVTALAHDDTLLVGTESGEVYDMFVHHEKFTGLWRRKLDGWVTSLVASDGDVFAGTFGGPVYSLRDGADVGTSRWEVGHGAMQLAATGRDVVGSDGGGLETYDSRSGETRWERGGRFGAAPAIAGDTVYVGGGNQGEDGNGFVAAYALSGGTGIKPLRFGGKRWQLDVESAVMEGVAVADGAVFAVTQSLNDSPSRVYALDPA